MKLGIIGAMSVEIETLKNAMANPVATERAGMVFYEGQLEGLDVVVVVCGVGKVNAAMCVQVLCDCFGVTHVLNTGIAGSLYSDLDIGDFVISQDAMYHDFNCHNLNPAYAIGQVPGLPVLRFPADQMLIDCAKNAAQQLDSAHVMVGTVASGDQFVCWDDVKQSIIENTQALCTEMEGAAIAHTAWKNQIPFVIIRAISDKADHSVEMEYPVFEAMAAKNCAMLTKTVAKYLSEHM